jgi:hypothetical protein
MSQSSYPSDLARVVEERLRTTQPNLPDTAILQELFEVMFFSSLKTEEGEAITYSVCYADPANPDPHAPSTMMADRWTYVPLSGNVSLTVQDMVKLAKATDVRSSSFAVYSDSESNLYVWALVDQSNSSDRYASFDTNEGFARPGIFQADIVGPGHLRVFDEFDHIAELSGGDLLPRPLDVLKSGILLTKLDDLLSTTAQDVTGETLSALAREFPLVLPDGRKMSPTVGRLGPALSRFRISSLRRLLIRMQSFGHGGAILITNEASTPVPDDLNIRRPLKYPRLSNAAQRLMAYHRYNKAATDIVGRSFAPSREAIPYSLFQGVLRSDQLIQETNIEIDHTLWFLALLTRIDGLVLLTPELDLIGFSVLITEISKESSEDVAIAEDVNATQISSMSATNFGTRHHSMLQYCSRHPSSVGFVVSQDGAVRAITQINDKTIMWRNIQLRRQTVSSDLPELPPDPIFQPGQDRP